MAHILSHGIKVTCIKYMMMMMMKISVIKMILNFQHNVHHQESQEMDSFSNLLLHQLTHILSSCF